MICFATCQTTDSYFTLSSYHYPCNASANKGAASTILMPLVWRGHGFDPIPTAPEADALLLELSGSVDIYIDVIEK